MTLWRLANLMILIWGYGCAAVALVWLGGWLGEGLRTKWRRRAVLQELDSHDRIRLETLARYPDRQSAWTRDL